MGKDDKRSFRATFLDCKNAQQKIIEWIDNLVKENRPIEPKKRFKFARLLANSCLGEDHRVSLDGSSLSPVLKKHDWEIDGIGQHVKPQTAGDVARFAMYETENYLSYGSRKEPIKQLWGTVRALLHRVFPFALRTAIASSQEIVGRGETEIHDYGTRKKIGKLPSEPDEE